MKKANKTVLGVFAPGPKATLAAAFLVATIISVPVFLGLMLADWIW